LGFNSASTIQPLKSEFYDFLAASNYIDLFINLSLFFLVNKYDNDGDDDGKL